MIQSMDQDCFFGGKATTGCAVKTHYQLAEDELDDAIRFVSQDNAEQFARESCQRSVMRIFGQK